MRRRHLIGILALGATTALAAGCVAHAQAGGYADADAPVVFTEQPTLVAVEPDVWVVRDYDDSVYYVDGNYWVYRRDRWYRSRSYDRGWVTVDVTAVPRTISTRDHRAYVHYRGAANSPTRKAPRERPASAPDDGPRRPPGHAAEPPGKSRHGGPPGDNNRASEHPGPRGGPGHDDRPEVGKPRRGEGDDDPKREEGKGENDRKGDGVKKDEKKDQKK